MIQLMNGLREGNVEHSSKVRDTFQPMYRHTPCVAGDYNTAEELQ